jgi:hypothetical protein
MGFGCMQVLGEYWAVLPALREIFESRLNHYSETDRTCSLPKNKVIGHVRRESMLWKTSAMFE